MTDHGTGLLIALPDRALGGVTTWAERTREVVGRRFVEVVCSPDPRHGFDEAVDEYIRTASIMLGAGRDRVLIAPQLSGACYAAACVAADRLDRACRGSVGLVGWMHTVIRHDIELLRRFAPGLCGVVSVSAAGARSLHGVIEERMITVAHTAVPVPDAPRLGVRASGPLRLIYTGRLERYQKRVLALPRVVESLRRQGIETELTIIGDGPARAELESLGQTVRGVTVLRPMRPSALVPYLTSADLYALPSRSEGLGLGRIEAALTGCASVVCAGSGGALEGIRSGVSGLIADIGPDADERAAGSAMGDAIAESVLDGGLAGIGALGERARRAMLELCDPKGYELQLHGLMERCGTSDSNRENWRSVSADPTGASTFTVPDDSAERLCAVLDAIESDAVVLYGGGNHTEAIWSSVRAHGVRIVAVIDDDPAGQGRSMHGVPVVSPADAGGLGVADVLLSSWLHEDALWARRSVLERAGLRVHRVYSTRDSNQSDPERLSA